MHPNKPSPRIHTLASAALILIPMLSACSDAQREYATPEALCGIEISPRALEPLMPPGDKVSLREKKGSGARRCDVMVDGKTVLATAVEWYEGGSSLEHVAARTVGVEPGDKKTADNRYLYSDTGAIGLVQCVDPSKIDQDVDGDLFATARVSGYSATESELKTLIIGYAKALSDSDACRGDIW
ncbi:hypothetical protein DMH02_022170 [Streptomyces sp. WAC 00631]|uniref:hypothetical protein n=1 Tax=Streptomyces sp. WAC 00631 TaxID=2203201 RepID=UPI000F7957A9|nr:hypothetical protein [Streptomyces sp. WAC 00631]MCC5035843.1 hypothetical protein [Streptomyces sp. WAC 00631]